MSSGQRNRRVLIFQAILGLGFKVLLRRAGREAHSNGLGNGCCGSFLISLKLLIYHSWLPQPRLLRILSTSQFVTAKICLPILGYIKDAIPVNIH